MSWDVVLFYSTETITDPGDLDETKLLPTDFATALKDHFGEVIESGGAWEVRREGYSLVFYEPEEAESNTMLNLYGEPALYELILLAKQRGWQIFDTGSGEMLDLDRPDRNGYAGFERYRQRVLRSGADER